MTNQRCGYGSVFGECGEGRNQVRVAHHTASEDGGENFIPICSNCLGFYYCLVDDEIETFGCFNPQTCEDSDTPFEHLVLGDFNEEEWAKNQARRVKNGASLSL
jgi:hypothetical protein